MKLKIIKGNPTAKIPFTLFKKFFPYYSSKYVSYF